MKQLKEKLKQKNKNLKRNLESNLKNMQERIIQIASGFINSDSGQLLNSLTATIENGGLSFGTRLHYGHYLEFGTSKMSARPFMRPTYLKVKKELISNLKAGVKK